MGTDALDADAANRLRARLHDYEQAMIRVWWEFNQKHPDIARIKELVAPSGPMPQPIPEPEAREPMSVMTAKPKVHAIPGVRYRRLTTGGFYEVVDLVTIKATGELAVVYKSTENGRRWVRPYEEFCDGQFEFAADLLLDQPAVSSQLIHN